MKRFEGFHSDDKLPIKKGDVITILKGAFIKTMKPSPTGGFVKKTAGRTYKVTVDHVLPGRNRPVGQPGHDGSYPVESPSVRWAGTGGYWYEVDLNEIPEATASS